MGRLVKICGVRTIEAAEAAVDADTDLVGVILVPERKRTVEHEVALKISRLVKEKRKDRGRKFQSIRELLGSLEGQKFGNVEDFFVTVQRLIIENGPFLVGVFRNQEKEEAFDIATKLDLDLVQLHGSEDKLGFCHHNKDSTSSRFGIIPRYVNNQDEELMFADFSKILVDGAYNGNGYTIPLLDSEAGGEGKVLDWNFVKKLKHGRYILAGGLNAENVQGTADLHNVIGLDVSGGVEDASGDKNLRKVREFITASRSI